MEIGETCLSLVIPRASLSAPFRVLTKPLFFGSPQQGASWMSQTQSPSSIIGSFRKEAQEETDIILKQQEDHSIYSLVVRIK